MVGIVSLGKRNTYSNLAHDWRTRYINEDSGISFPNINVQLAPGGATFVSNGVFCSQRGTQALVQHATVACPAAKCYNFLTSSFQAAAAYEGQNHITCNFLIQALPTDNTEMNVTVPQGFIWQPNPPTYVQANVLAEVDFYRERLVTLDGTSADEWWTQVTYQTSDFFTGPVFNATIMFRIPIRAMIANFEYIAFDQWMLLGAWGGAIFFMYFLHGIVYGILKLWLPNDSKLFPAPESASAYEPIK